MVYKNIRQKEDSHNKIMIIVLLSFIFFILAFIAYISFFSDNVEIDRSKKGKTGTLCPLVNEKAVPNNHSVILIDTTDSLDSLQLASLESNVSDIVASLEPGDLLSIFTLSGTNTKERTPLFEKCLPRDGSDANALTENQKKIRKVYISEFEKPLLHSLKSIGEEAKKAKVSPIFERIQFIAVASFDHWKTEGNRNLYIFSDMLQNTPSYSMFKLKDNNYEALKKSSYGIKVKANLADVDVEIYRFNNHPELQKNGNSLFWQEYFKDAGGRLQLIKNLGSDTLKE